MDWVSSVLFQHCVEGLWESDCTKRALRWKTSWCGHYMGRGSAAATNSWPRWTAQRVCWPSGISSKVTIVPLGKTDNGSPFKSCFVRPVWWPRAQQTAQRIKSKRQERASHEWHRWVHSIFWLSRTLTYSSLSSLALLRLSHKRIAKNERSHGTQHDIDTPCSGPVRNPHIDELQAQRWKMDSG